MKLKKMLGIVAIAVVGAAIFAVIARYSKPTGFVGKLVRKDAAVITGGSNVVHIKAGAA